MTENTKIVAAIEGIDEDAWTPVKYPGAVQDPDTGAWISDAEVAATTYTAFESSKHAVTARLIVRRIIAIPARLARPARKPVLHLPAGWPGQHPLSICGTTQSPSPEPLHNRPHRDQEPATSNQQPAITVKMLGRPANCTWLQHISPVPTQVWRFTDTNPRIQVWNDPPAPTRIAGGSSYEGVEFTPGINRWPASTGSAAPVMEDANAELRKSVASAIVSGGMKVVALSAP